MRLKNCKLFGKRGLSILLTLILCTGMVTPAFAIQYDMGTGSVHVENDDDGNTVSWQDNHAEHGSKDMASTDKDIIVTGTTKTNTVIVGEGVKDTTITLSGVTIENTKYNVDTLSIGKNSNVKIELDGQNTLKSGGTAVGLQEQASVTIQDAVKAEDKTPASLDAQGSDAGIGSGRNAWISRGGSGNITITDGAVVNAVGNTGIGSNLHRGVGNITITGGAKVTATGQTGSGIGSGYINSKAGNITIDNADVVAASSGGAGIGSSVEDYGKAVEVGDIRITNNAKVTATGGKYSAGIGQGSSSGQGGNVGNITIEKGATVTATGGERAAGIGGNYGKGTLGNITIDGATVTATGGMAGAGIGGGQYDKPDTNITISNSEVNATGGKYAAGIGGGGWSSSIGDITIENSKVTATPGEAAAAIGPGKFSSFDMCSVGDITITGGTLTIGSPSTSSPYTDTVGRPTSFSDSDLRYLSGEIKVYTQDKDGNLLYIYRAALDDAEELEKNRYETYWKQEYTITVPEGKEAEYNEEAHTLVIPAGSTVKPKYEDAVVYSDGAFIDAQGKITAKDHDYQVTETVPATCTEAGSTTKVCSICGDTQVTPITKLGHDIQTETKAPTCTEAGSVTKTCSRCDYKEVTSQGKPLEHDIQTVTKAATCTEAGSVTETCSRCDYVNVVSTTEKLGHDYQVTETKDATCTEAGSQTEVCSRCKDEKVTTTDPALKHDYQVTETTEASCTDNGSETHTCTRCKDAYTTVIEAKGHTEEIIPAVPATETESGWTEGLRCSECGEVLQAPVEIPATGPVNPENPEQPETPETPDVPAPGGDDDFGDDGAGTATIAEQEVPLAGIVLVKDVLAELYKHAGSPDGVDAEGEYTKAIAWAIANGLMDENDDVDAVVTVAVLKSMLTNYAASVGGVLTVSIDGEDDDVVMNCGEILAEVFKTL